MTLRDRATPRPPNVPARRGRSIASLLGALTLAAGMTACREQPTQLLPEALAADVGRPSQLITSTEQKLVISQVYGGGGGTTSVLLNDFVELFNAGAVNVSLSGMSLQYASASGTGLFGSSSTQLVTLPAVTLVPGQYFLVSLAAGNTIGAPLPTPNASGTIAMAAAAGKVALVNAVAPLGCNGGSTACSAAQLANIVDLVGYGAANFFEGTAPAPAPSALTAVRRISGGCTDTNNNASDWAVAAPPTPRNMATPLAPCAALPAVLTVSPLKDAVDVALDANIAVTFDRAVTVADGWYGVACTVSGAHPAAVTGGPSSFTLDPATNFAYGDNCTVTVTGSKVADAANATATMAANYTWSFTTYLSDPCLATFTPAYTIQGSGLATPLASVTVSTQGVVVGDYEGPAPALRGFYLQDATGDGNAETSDALFVFNGNNDNVSVGDIVRVTGTAAEFQEQTQVSATSVVSCGTGSVAPVAVTLPMASLTAFERFEGMLVTMPQTLFVTEHFQLGRFGQVVLSSGARLQSPTHVAAPGAAAIAVSVQNALNRIVVDDANNGENRDPIVFGRNGNPLSASNTLRGGDMATGVTGVMTYTWAGAAASGNAYRVRPVGALGGSVSFAAANMRPSAPSGVGGTLRVAALNLLNYFNTFSGCRNGAGGPSTDCRGAENALEFSRQSVKTVSAIVGLNADVVGIVEIENDGYDAASAIADLVTRLNGATAPGTYAYINADAATSEVNTLGTDAIKVGLLYKPAAVTPVGRTGTLNSVLFVNGGESGPRNRPALAQTFQQPNGARVVVVVNHLKSKGSACTAPDAGDGQGNCNGVRNVAAAALRDWLATDPTETGDPDVLILGDLNAYAMEDPITTLRTAGFVDLFKGLIGTSAYSYAFDGQWGYLDHALASRSLAPQVNGVTEWHINADEPAILDYNTEFKSPGQIASLFAADPFRVSDHDPVLVGLTLAPPIPFGGFLSPIEGGAAFNLANAPGTVPVKFSLDGDRGLQILAPGYPRSRPIDCSTGAILGAASSISTPGRSTLVYDAGTDLYQINWMAPNSWSGTCRELLVTFTDGTQHTARFSFR
ncbi:MAG: ExeM/NucH family extracellular endonuclease [Gemmatimonadota bacterium]